jgi:Mechanosensitive ion channel, conserved TM helix
VFSYLPNVVAAVLIFVIASALAGWLGRSGSRLFGTSPTGRLVATGFRAHPRDSGGYVMSVS